MSQILSKVLAGTPAQFDADDSLATTEFVQRAIGNVRGLTAIAANTTLSTAHVGSLLVVSGTRTLTLPDSGTVPDGATIAAVVGSASTATFSAQGANRVQAGALEVVSIALQEGEQIVLVNRASVGRWVAAGGSGAMLGAALLRVGGRLLVGTDVSTSNFAGTPAAEFAATDADVMRVIRENGNVDAAAGRVLLSGLNSVGEVTDYASVDVVMEAINNGAERGAVRLRAMTAGAMAEVMKITGNGDVYGSSLATTAEARAFTSATKLLTPSTLFNSFTGTNQDKSSQGHQNLPGGVIIQWGSGTDTATNKNFPIEFPTAVFAMVAAQKLAAVGDASQPADCAVFVVSNSQYRVTVGDQNGAHQYYWIAIGH